MTKEVSRLSQEWRSRRGFTPPHITDPLRHPSCARLTWNTRNSSKPLWGPTGKPHYTALGDRFRPTLAECWHSSFRKCYTTTMYRKHSIVLAALNPTLFIFVVDNSIYPTRTYNHPVRKPSVQGQVGMFGPQVCDACSGGLDIQVQLVHPHTPGRIANANPNIRVQQRVSST